MVNVHFVNGPLRLPETPHALPPEALTAMLGVSEEVGLSREDAEKRLRAVGSNAIEARPAATWFALLLHQFMTPVVYLLTGAAGLAFYFNKLEEGAAIAAVLAVNAVIGFYTELKAVRSIEALRALGAHTARVLRNRVVIRVPAENLVPGDVVVIEAGEAVCADLRLIEASRLAVNESTLTGESVPVEKDVQSVSQGARLSERRSMLFKGTTVTRGSGRGVVTATGLATELGKVSRLIIEVDAGNSPMERKLSRLSTQLVAATLIVASVIAALGLISGQDELLVIEAAIALAVAAIPEGLPIVATLALARGMWRMAEQNALIERLSAVETLGATTVILTDKTGTLTENRMTVQQLLTSSGDVVVNANPPDNTLLSRAGADQELSLLLTVAVLCNDADLENAAAEGTGDPMEIALLRAGLTANMSRSDLLLKYPLLRKHAFNPSTKMMGTIHSSRDGILIAVKGAPESIINSAAGLLHEGSEIRFDDETRSKWNNNVGRLADHGLRVLACAVGHQPQEPDDPFHQLFLVGLIGLQDPARADVPEAIRDCQNAGIRVVMVTGDHVETARSIGRAVGLDTSEGNVVEGRELYEMLKTGAPALRDVGIFARVDPSEKLTLVRAYQNAGDIVAMTGDGVNDAPALRQADIGVSMGLRGTDVAREAAAMILLDDKFSTIVKAIREGRIIFANIRRLVGYLLSCNLSELMVIGLAVAGSLPLPLLPLQILYLNLVTDVFPAFALAMGEGEHRVLNRPPRDPKEAILGRAQWLAVILHAMAMSAATFAALGMGRWLGLDQRASVTVTFLTLAFAQLWHVFNLRSHGTSIFVNEVTGNRWLWSAIGLCALLLALPPYVGPAAHLLQLVPPTLQMWLVVLFSSTAPLIVTQIVMLTLSGTRPNRF
ncbi:cation-translocating P-type ATPase [Rhizobium mesosinicum]|uniref:Cation-transporting P-type ATPase n=1 Tax=Rhizobium mesosinicum TaxID=335017 RepID=A0ABS7GRB1_9HYPH|nr:cation-transporting P-type ATPase [Rhizobium mesosinicum]MBW9052352.1 cation-transporting P-type ATPase [Rhizobium mesosinicum]